MQYAMTEKHFPNLYDLFALHIQARGEQVDDQNQADTIFAVDQGIRPTDLDNILANFI